jgi:hypothetical protein
MISGFFSVTIILCMAACIYEYEWFLQPVWYDKFAFHINLNFLIFQLLNSGQYYSQHS